MNLTGTYLGKYKLIERLGQGAMAQVYKAHQPTIDRLVAIKVMHAHLAESPDFVERFKREARGLGQLRHPHIVSVLDFEAVDEQYFMVMDYIAGPTLHDFLKQYQQEKGPLPLPHVLQLGGQLADALAYAHQRDIIHRDLKPGNVMLWDESGQHAMLTDFGLVRLLDQVGMTMSGTVAGTPAYMSPEAARGERVDGRADIYSLGVILYEMVTGRLPFTGDTPVSLMLQHLTEPLPPLRETHPELPEPVIALIERALAKDVEARFQDAAEMSRAIRQAQLSLENGGVLPTMLLNTQIEPAAASGMAAIPGTAVLTPPLQKTIPPGGRSALQPQAAPAPLPERGSRRLLWAGGAVLLLALLASSLVWGLGLFEDESQVADAADDENITAEVDIPFTDTDRLGVLRFHGDKEPQVTVEVEQAAAPPAGSHYEGWIQTTDGRTISLGPLPVQNGSIQATLPVEPDLLPRFEKALISLEADDGTAAVPSEQIAFQGNLSAPFVAELRQLFVASDEITGKGYFPAALEQTNLAILHHDMLQVALANGNLTEAKQHAEHLVNILDGESGEAFGDLDRNGQVENPGDGVGVRVYLTGANAHITAAVELLPPTQVRQTRAAEAIAANNRALASLDSIVATATKLIAADAVSEASVTAQQLIIPLIELLNGSDLDGSGAIEAERGEGALLAAAELVSALSEVSLYADTAQPAVTPPEAEAGGAGRPGAFHIEPKNSLVLQLQHHTRPIQRVYCAF